MNDDVFKAFGWFPGELGIQPDASALWIANAPPGSHALDEKMTDAHFKPLFPFCDERAGGIATNIPLTKILNAVILLIDVNQSRAATSREAGTPSGDPVCRR